jgi:hypothetical protein
MTHSPDSINNPFTDEFYYVKSILKQCLAINSSRFSFILFLFVTVITSSAYGQGCSDAGFCSMNSIKSSGDDSLASKNNQIKIGGFYGIADNSISVWGNTIEYTRKLSGKIELDAKLTSLSQNGNGISEFGLSDLFLTGNYKLGDKLKFTLGAKVPFTDGNNKRNSVPLPMDYQSSLGTVDLLLGFGFIAKKFQFVLALQQPLTQNKNQFVKEEYPLNSPIRQFQSTKNFNRSGDVFLRISRPLKLASNMKLTPGLLPIYHLSNDSYTDSLGIKKDIDGSAGLTLNGSIGLDFELTTNSAIQLIVAAPFIVRESRPDGLTRSFIGNIEYRVRF